MAFDFMAGLTDYVDQQRLPLITRALFEGKTASLLTKQIGVKHTAALNILGTDAVFQYGKQCSWNPNGETSLSQREITAVKVSIMEELCPDELEEIWAQSLLPAGTRYSNIPFEQAYTDLKVGSIQEGLETQLWQSDGTSGSILGLQQILNTTSGVVDGQFGTPMTWATFITSNNAVLAVQQIYNNLKPTLLGKDDVHIFMGWDAFRIYTNQLVNANYFNMSYLNGATAGELILPGTNVKITAVHGLNGTRDLYASRLSNLFMATDVLDEQAKFSINYDEYSMKVRFLCEFKAGTQIAFPDECVKFVMA